MSEARPVTVTCYAGYTGDQEPRAVTVDGVTHRVTEIVRRWREPDADWFDVQTDGGARFRLRQDRDSGAWSIA